MHRQTVFFSSLSPILIFSRPYWGQSTLPRSHDSIVVLTSSHISIENRLSGNYVTRIVGRQIAPHDASPRRAAPRAAGGRAGSGGERHSGASNSPAPHRRPARPARCGPSPGRSVSRSAARCAGRRRCSSPDRAAGAAIRSRTAGCHARLRRRSQLWRHRATGALGSRRNELRRRSTATRRRPELSLGRISAGASACWQGGR